MSKPEETTARRRKNVPETISKEETSETFSGQFYLASYWTEVYYNEIF